MDVASSEELFGDDPSHPIPYLGRIDTFVTTQEKTCYYGLVIASPLRDDYRSRRRLLKKIGDYVEDRHSSEARREFGVAASGNTKLSVLIHPGSDSTIFELLEQCRAALEESGFAYEVTTDAKLLGLH